MKAPFRPVARESVSHWPEGDQPAVWIPGDFILTHNDRPFSRLIRFGQKLRIHGRDRVYTWWSHAALVVSESGDLIEANRPGVIRTHVDDYRDVEYEVVHTGALPLDRTQAVAFAEYCAAHHQRLGRTIFVSIALNLITGGKLDFFVDGTTVCSGLVARAQERTGAIFNRSPSHIMPADLAKYYGVPPRRRGRRESQEPSATRSASANGSAPEKATVSWKLRRSPRPSAR